MTTALVYQYMYHKTIQVLHKLPSTQPEPIRTAMTALSDPATAHPGVFFTPHTAVPLCKSHWTYHRELKKLNINEEVSNACCPCLTLIHTHRYIHKCTSTHTEANMYTYIYTITLITSNPYNIQST